MKERMLMPIPLTRTIAITSLAAQVTMEPATGFSGNRVCSMVPISPRPSRRGLRPSRGFATTSAADTP